MATTKSERTRLIAAADEERRRADLAHKAGNAELRDARLNRARELYMAAGMAGMAGYCERFIGTK